MKATTSTYVELFRFRGKPDVHRHWLPKILILDIEVPGAAYAALRAVANRHSHSTRTAPTAATRRLPTWYYFECSSRGPCT